MDKLLHDRKIHMVPQIREWIAKDEGMDGDNIEFDEYCIQIWLKEHFENADSEVVDEQVEKFQVHRIPDTHVFEHDNENSGHLPPLNA